MVLRRLVTSATVATLVLATTVVTGPPRANAAVPAANGSDVAILLPTGERILPRPGGSAAVTRGGAGSASVSLRLGGRSYVLPAAALRRIGRGLDLSLFDLSALRAVERNGRVPLRIDYAGARPAIPGVTMTGPHTGYLTAASALAFGAALARPAFLGSGVRLSLDGAVRSPARPRYPMRTLTVTAKDGDGRPDNDNRVFVYNVEDSLRFGAGGEGVGFFYQGTAKFSVPAGRYAAVALFVKTDASGAATAVWQVAQPEFSVTDNATIDLSAAAATSRVSVTTERPAQPRETAFILNRAPVTGPALYLNVGVPTGVPYWVSPVATPVTTGSLDSVAYQRLTSPKGAPGLPYEYAVQFPTSGHIPAQAYHAVQRDLVTIDEKFSADTESVGARSRTGIYPYEFGQFGGGNRPEYDLALPTRQIAYLTTGHSVLWSNQLARYTKPVPEFPRFRSHHGLTYDGLRSYAPGQRVHEDWNAYPLHATGAVNPLGEEGQPAVTQPLAARAGDTVRFAVWGMSDNQSGHTGFPIDADDDVAAGGTYRVDQDGTTVSSGEIGQLTAVPDVTLRPEPSTVRLVFDLKREGSPYRLSTRSHTEWTWRSQHRQGGVLPPGYACAFTDQGADRGCTAEPLITVRSAVRGLSLRGTMAPGLQEIGLRFGHVPTAAGPAITGAKVEFSVDDGKTWRTAVTRPLGGGRYTAVYPVVGRNAYVTLRLSASDAGGGQLTETVFRAYQVA